MEEIVNDLVEYFKAIGEDANQTLLTLFTSFAIENVANKRYPFGYTEDEKSSVILKYRSVIFNAVLYAYGKIGAEGEVSHNENGINRAWIDEVKLYSDIVPMAKVI